MSQHTPREPNEIDILVGARVRLARQAIKMSQEKLGDAVGVTFQQIQKYERGANRMGASRLWTVCETLGIDLNYLFEDVAGDSTLVVNPDRDLITEFVNSGDGIAFAQAISAIPKGEPRRRVLELLRSMAPVE